MNSQEPPPDEPPFDPPPTEPPDPAERAELVRKLRHRLRHLLPASDPTPPGEDEVRQWIHDGLADLDLDGLLAIHLLVHVLGQPSHWALRDAVREVLELFAEPGREEG